MDISKAIADLKKEPGFAENVGMLLIHNGVVRAWSRKDRSQVGELRVEVNQAVIDRLRDEYSGRPGIFRILIEATSGTFRPGDDLLFIVVAGDIRENVKPVLAELLDRIKAEAVTKKEIPPH